MLHIDATELKRLCSIADCVMERKQEPGKGKFVKNSRGRTQWKDSCPSFPILGYARMRAVPGEGLWLTTTNLKVATEQLFSCTVLEGFDVLVPLWVLRKFEFKGMVCIFELVSYEEGSRLIFLDSMGELTLLTKDASDFPALPESKRADARQADVVTIGPDLVKAMWLELDTLNRIKKASKQLKETRGYLTTVDNGHYVKLSLPSVSFYIYQPEHARSKKVA